MQKIYLAHNFGSRFKVRDNIIPILEKKYSEWEIINPFTVKERYNEGLYEYKGTSEKEINEIFGNIDKRNADIVENDLRYIDGCDMLVAYIERSSVGTSMEIFYAWYVKRMPVVLIFDTDIDLFYHPWLNYFSNDKILLDKSGIFPLTDGVPIDLKKLHAFEKYGNEVALLLAKKNVAYKKSASGLSYVGIGKRLNEKQMRTINLIHQDMDGNDDEPIRETLIDIPGYGIIQLMCHDKAFPFEEGFVEQTLLSAFTDEELLLEIRKRGV